MAYKNTSQYYNIDLENQLFRSELDISETLLVYNLLFSNWGIHSDFCMNRNES